MESADYRGCRWFCFKEDMSDSAHLSSLPYWQVEYKQGSQTKRPVARAPNATKAVELIKFEVRQISNQPITILKVTRVKKP